MSLTDAQIRAAKPKEKTYRLFDSGGLYLEVAPSGGRWWRFKYRYDGKEKRLSFGTYPEVPLAGRKDKVTGVFLDVQVDRGRIEPGVTEPFFNRRQRDVR